MLAVVMSSFKYYCEFSLYYIYRIVRDNRLTTARPRQEHQEGQSYCADNKCYTPTEFALFGVSNIVSYDFMTQSPHLDHNPYHSDIHNNAVLVFTVL